MNFALSETTILGFLGSKIVICSLGKNCCPIPQQAIENKTIATMHCVMEVNKAVSLVGCN